MILRAAREVFAAIGLAVVLVELVTHHFSGKWIL